MYNASIHIHVYDTHIPEVAWGSDASYVYMDTYTRIYMWIVCMDTYTGICVWILTNVQHAHTGGGLRERCNCEEVYMCMYTWYVWCVKKYTRVCIHVSYIYVCVCMDTCTYTYDTHVCNILHTHTRRVMRERYKQRRGVLVYVPILYHKRMCMYT